MPRKTKLTVLNDTSLFDSMQLQLRPILTIGMRCWAQWAHENLYGFSRLIREHRFGLVVVGAHVEYERPFTFFSADCFEVEGYAEVVQGRRLILGHMSFLAGDERIVSLRLVSRPVAMAGADSFAAMPTTLQGPLLEKFTPPEITDRRIERELPKLLEGLGGAAQIAEGVLPVRLLRHDCEAADQWSYIEIGAHAASARESLVMQASGELRERLQPAIASPTRRVDLEIRRPAFVFDELQILTRAYLHEQRMTFVHTFQSRIGGRHDHAVVVECF